MNEIFHEQGFTLLKKRFFLYIFISNDLEGDGAETVMF